MSANYTPGPWQVGPEYENRLSRSVWRGSFYDKASTVARFVATDADARLIAAAPDLLAALQECFLLLQQLGAEGEPGDMPSPTLEKARAAIAHATGNS
jgi:hypothetical protein